ncbi:MAG: hypothetical protein ABIK43_01010, partial [candidate division WOR-3 bacterium]
GRLVVAEELLWRTTPEPHAEPTSAEAVDHPWRGALPIEVRYRCPAISLLLVVIVSPRLIVMNHVRRGILHLGLSLSDQVRSG